MSKKFPFPKGLTQKGINDSASDAALSERLGLKLVRYLRSDSEKTCRYLIFQLFQTNGFDVERILGFYYGYIGGGMFGDGTFINDLSEVQYGGDQDVRVFRGDDASESDDVEPDDYAILEMLRELAFTYVDLDDDTLEMTFRPAGRALMAQAEMLDGGDILYCDERFLGDFLHVPSQEWEMTISFDEE